MFSRTQRGATYLWVAAGSLVLITLALVQYTHLDGNLSVLNSYAMGGGWYQNRAVANWQRFQSWTFPDKVLATFDGLRDLKAEFKKNRAIGCRHWTPEQATEVLDDRYDGCWRHKPYVQLHNFLKTEGVERQYLTGDRDVQALQRLYSCYMDVNNQLACSDNEFRVLFGLYRYFVHSFNLQPLPSGELIWQHSQILALQAQNFTLISVEHYADMVHISKQIPDVISVIWLEDQLHMSCEHDPRCVKDFRSTYDTYPDFRSIDHRPLWPGSLAPGADVEPHQWLYEPERLDKVPQKERGMIPKWKLFTATVWGTHPGQGIQRIPEYPLQDFSYGQLGNQWTVSPFQWPNHTYLPFSIEHECMKTPYRKRNERKNGFFVLAKKIEYFYRTRAPGSHWWSRVVKELGIDVTSAAGNDEHDDKWELPEGVTTMGRLTPEQYTAEVSRSVAMIAIGAPTISPSPYYALCAGTPVLMPYYKDVRPDNPWYIMAADVYSQHGPLLLQVGPPYVYPYRAGNETDFIEKLSAAAANPIDRYFIPEQRWDAVKERLDWYMWHDWERMADSVMAANNDQYSLTHLITIGRCFDMGACHFLHAG